MNRQIPEYLEAEWQTAKDEYKVKTTTYITITKFEYEKLQLENLQLEEKCEMYERQRDRWKKRSNKLAKKCDKNRLVLDEIREQLKLERKLALSLNKPYTVSVIDKLLDKVEE